MAGDGRRGRGLLAGSLPATASDGAIEINQAKALAGAINGDLAAGHVTLDLGGFSIRGPNDCVVGSWATSCLGAGTGRGIFDASAFIYGIKVRNGSIRGMGAEGIRFDLGVDFELPDLVVMDNGGSGIEVEISGALSRVVADQNGGRGISAGERSLVSECIARDNSGNGIQVGRGVVSRSIASGNASGIGAAGGVVRDSTSSDNRSTGIFGSAPGLTIQGNAISGNGTYGITASDAVITGNTVTGSGSHGIDVQARSSVTENLIRDNAGCGVNFSAGGAGRTGSPGGNTIIENNTGGSCTGVGTQRQFQGFSMATTCNVITCTTGGLLLGTLCPPNLVTCLS